MKLKTKIDLDSLSDAEKVERALKLSNMMRTNGTIAYAIRKRAIIISAMFEKRSDKSKLMDSLNKLSFDDVLSKLIKIITAQFNLFKTALRFIDTQSIDKNTLSQTTYYKTLTSRP